MPQSFSLRSTQFRRRQRTTVGLLVVAALIGVVAGLALTRHKGANRRARTEPAVAAPAHQRTPPTTGASVPVTSTTIAPASAALAPPAPAPAPAPAAPAPSPVGALAGKIVAIDSGHNGGNAGDPAAINKLIWNGRASETCDTTGTATDGGYTEAQFNFNVARALAADLQSQGAKVVLTRPTNTGVGPCVTDRAAIGNEAHADVALSIHADGGPPSGRGFAVLEPVADGPNNKIVAPSAVLGQDLRATFLAGTGEPVSTYDGVNGIQPRSDLGGTNLSTVPKVFIECANMRNATDARPPYQRRLAEAGGRHPRPGDHGVLAHDRVRARYLGSARSLRQQARRR